MPIWLAMGRGHDTGVYLSLEYMSAVNAAHHDFGACRNNALKLAESLPDRNHINCTMITG